MKHFKKSYCSIYAQLAKLILLASLIAGITYFVSDYISSNVIDSYIYDTNFVKKKNDLYIQKLKSFVAQESVSTKDASKITKWVNQQGVVILEIYQNNTQVYDSTYQNQDEYLTNIEVSEDIGISSTQVRFTDGEATVMLTGLYNYQLRTYTRIASIVLSFLTLLSVVLLGIRHKIKYIRQLSSDLFILESGDLSHNIQIQGQDELSDLAQSIDDMRISFLTAVESEAEIVQKNKDIITELSHDLRTPITSILLYLEILRNSHFKNTEQALDHLSVIEQKALQMKQVSENLFKHSLTQADSVKNNIERIPLSEALEIMCEGLELQGFRTVLVSEIKESELLIPSEKILRITDNILSNIIKYGDQSKDIHVSLLRIDEEIKVTISNVISKHLSKDSTGVGLKSIKRSIEQLGGRFETSQNEDQFMVTLYFNS